MELKITAPAGGHSIIIEREFDAGIQLVFDILSKPGYLLKWQFAEEAALTIEKYDCQSGGSYLSWHTGPNNRRFGFTGVFHEVKEPELIIQTSEFLGLPVKVVPTLELTRLQATGSGSTKLTKQIICVSNEVRDLMLQNGMEQHFTGSFSRIDGILKNK